ncbi:MAG: sodium:solute symporter [Alistipes sp.]|nr:sodium:solute symporter [Alistipes sp.]
MSTSLIVIISLCYIVLLLLVARVAARGGDNSTFFTGGRKMAWGWVALGMIGAPMSGVSFISVPGSVATDGFSYMIMVAGFTLGQVVIALLILPLLYRLRVTSLYQYLDHRFGTLAHRAGAMLFIGSKLSVTALKLFAFLIVAETLLKMGSNLSFALSATLLVVIIWAFTRNGGVKSVVWTDVLQSIMLIGAVVVTIVTIPITLDISFGEMLREVWQSPHSELLPEGAATLARTPLQLFFGGVFILIAMTGLDQDMMQRNLSCKSLKSAQKSIYTTALAQAGVIFMLLVMGAMLYIYADRVALGEVDGDRVYAMVATHSLMPLVVGVMFILGMLSSSLSTAGSALTALTTSYTYDIYGEERIADSKALKQIRGRVHIVMAVAVLLLIILFRSLTSTSLISLLFSVVSYLYGPILALFVFGIVSKRMLRSRWLMAVIIASPILAATLKYCAHTIGYNIGFELIIYNALICFLGLYAISYNEKSL